MLARDEIFGFAAAKKQSFLIGISSDSLACGFHNALRFHAAFDWKQNLVKELTKVLICLKIKPSCYY